MNLPVVLSKNLQTLTKFQTQELGFDFADELIRTKTPQEAASEITRLKAFIEVVDTRIREELKFVPPGEYYGCQISIKKGRTTWDYSTDPEWRELQEQIKLREKFLQTLKAPIEYIDDESGEISVLAMPPIKKESEPSISITIK